MDSTLLGAVVASFTALFIAGGGGKFVKEFFYYPYIKLPFNVVRNKQNHYMWRIAIQNDGNAIAKDVQVDVISIIEDGRERENFIPMPLRWTHLSTESRDIIPKQIVYLDVLEQHTVLENTPLFGTVNLATKFGEGINDFRNLKISDTETTLNLVIYEKRGECIPISIEVVWTSKLFLDMKLKGKDWHLKLLRESI